MEVVPELIVDTGRGQKMRINFDIVVHKIGCECKCHSPTTLANPIPIHGLFTRTST